MFPRWYDQGTGPGADWEGGEWFAQRGHTPPLGRELPQVTEGSWGALYILVKEYILTITHFDNLYIVGKGRTTATIPENLKLIRAAIAKL